MKLDDYKALVTKIVTEPDVAEATATDLINALTEDDGIRQGYESQIEELNNRITKLNETNSKLFLNMTGSPKEAKEDEELEKSPKEIFNTLFDERYYGGKE